MNARLFCKTGALSGSEYQIDEEATIGRWEQNDITLPPDAVSGQHARIFFDEDEDCYLLEDLDSNNGTHLDDTEVIDPVPLKDLHIITFARELDFIFLATSKKVAASPAEGAKTQHGAPPESPSDLPDDEPEGERTRIGQGPGVPPDLPGEESTSETKEEDTTEEDRTQFGESPPELPDLSEGDESEEDEPEGERTRMRETPGGLPDLPDEESTSETEEEDTTEEEDHTQFGESPPDLPDLSKEDEREEDGPEEERTRMGEGPGRLPDLPDEGSTPKAEEEDPSEEDHTQFGESPPDLPDLSEEDEPEEDESEEERTRMRETPGGLPDLPDEESTSETEEQDTTEEDRTQFGESPPDLPGFSDEDESEEDESEDLRTRMKDALGAPDGASPRYALQVILEGDPRGTHSLPEGEVTIGRASDCDIQIEDPGVSRQHARLIVKPGEVVVEDVGSKNFTFVNGDRLSGPTPLSPGSEIQFGLQAKAILQRASS